MNEQSSAAKIPPMKRRSFNGSKFPYLPTGVVATLDEHVVGKCVMALWDELRSMKPYVINGKFASAVDPRAFIDPNVYAIAETRILLLAKQRNGCALVVERLKENWWNHEAFLSGGFEGPREYCDDKSTMFRTLARLYFDVRFELDRWNSMKRGR